MERDDSDGLQGVLLNQIQLLLAEKRTSLALMRTGIAVFALPLSVLSALIATSKYYDFMRVVHLLIPLLIICFGLVVLGSYLIIRTMVRIRNFDKIVREIKKENEMLSRFLD